LEKNVPRTSCFEEAHYFGLDELVVERNIFEEHRRIYCHAVANGERMLDYCCMLTQIHLRSARGDGIVPEWKHASFDEHQAAGTKEARL